MSLLVLQYLSTFNKVLNNSQFFVPLSSVGERSACTSKANMKIFEGTIFFVAKCTLVEIKTFDAMVSILRRIWSRRKK